MILTGFFGAFRRSELVSIQVRDLVWEPEGTDYPFASLQNRQQMQGLASPCLFGTKGCCPATAIKDWVDLCGINNDSTFQAGQPMESGPNKAAEPGAINDLLKNLGKACQFDFLPDLSSHSFRRGLSTSAARERIDFELIKKQGGWKSDAPNSVGIHRGGPAVFR